MIVRLIGCGPSRRKCSDRAEIVHRWVVMTYKNVFVSQELNVFVYSFPPKLTARRAVSETFWLLGFVGVN